MPRRHPVDGSDSTCWLNTGDATGTCTGSVIGTPPSWQCYLLTNYKILDIFLINECELPERDQMTLSVRTNSMAFVAIQSFNDARSATNVVANCVGSGLKVAGAVDDASNFSIAQGVRSDSRAWEAINQGLGFAQGALKVTLAATTNISNLLNDLQGKYVEYFATDADRQPIVEADINAILDQIDLMANGATYRDLNLINRDQDTLAFTPPPDQGTTFTLAGAGPQQNSHALGTTAGLLQVNYSGTGTGGGNFQLQYNGGTVASTTLTPPSTATGSLTFSYDATGPATFTVRKTGSPNLSVDYSFTLTPTGLSGVEGEFRVLKALNGEHADIQFRSMLATDIGLRPPVLSNVSGALGQIEAARREVNEALGYYGAKYREVTSAREASVLYLDALKEGLGNIVDADLGRDSAELTATQVREKLAQDTLSIASRATSVVLNLFD